MKLPSVNVVFYLTAISGVPLFAIGGIVTLSLIASIAKTPSQREIGHCEGRGGVWVRDYGCVHPPVPMEVG